MPLVSQKKGKRDWVQKKVFEEIMTENISNVVKHINLQVQEAQETSNKIHSNKIMTRHIIIKLMKTKNKKKGLFVQNSY